MTDRIVLEGGVVRHERIDIVSTAPAEALDEFLVRRIDTTMPVLPSHPVRWMTFRGQENTGMFLVEQKPGVRAIRVLHGGSGHYPDDEQRHEPHETFGIWRVQFPWQYWAFPFRTNIHDGHFGDFVIDNSYLFWRREQWQSDNDQLWPAPVPNVTSAGGICWGNTNATNASLAQRIDDYINTFTATIFNEDLGHFTPFGNSLTEWENNSPADNPLAWRDWHFWEHPGQHRPTTVTAIAVMNHREPINIAELNPAFINPPTIPENFTVARARQYLESLDEAARIRLVTVGNAMLAGQVDDEMVP